jgi:hypothetical protein
LSQSGIEKRRSPRVLARIPIQLLGGDAPVHALTAVVNRHGALILAPVGYRTDSIVWLRNEKSAMTIRCRVVWATADDTGNNHKIGLEFVDQAPEFWGADYDDAVRAESARERSPQRT